MTAFEAGCRPSAEAAALAPTSRTVCRFKRVYALQGRPIGLVSAVVCEFGRPLTFQAVERLPVYGLLQQIGRISVARADLAVRTCVAGQADALALELREGDPLLAIHRTSYDERARPVETTTFLIRPEHYEFCFSVQGPVQIAPAIRLVQPS